MTQQMIVKGFDFTSAPRRKKPITCARGLLTADILRIERIDYMTDFWQFEVALKEPGRVTCFHPDSRPRLREQLT